MNKPLKFQDWLSNVVDTTKDLPVDAPERHRDAPVAAELGGPVLAFLEFAQALDNIAARVGAAAPKSTEQSLLELIALWALRRNPLTVTEVILKRDIASPSTLHAKLMALRKSGWVSWQIGDDGRTKYLEPTERTLEYFANIGNALGSLQVQ